MEVKPGIVVNFYEAESNSTKPVAKVVLKERATSVKVRTSLHLFGEGNSQSQYFLKGLDDHE